MRGPCGPRASLPVTHPSASKEPDKELLAQLASPGRKPPRHGISHSPHSLGKESQPRRMARCSRGAGRSQVAAAAENQAARPPRPTHSQSLLAPWPHTPPLWTTMKQTVRLTHFLGTPAPCQVCAGPERGRETHGRWEDRQTLTGQRHGRTDTLPSAETPLWRKGSQRPEARKPRAHAGPPDPEGRAGRCPAAGTGANCEACQVPHPRDRGLPAPKQKGEEGLGVRTCRQEETQGQDESSMGSCPPHRRRQHCCWVRRRRSCRGPADRRPPSSVFPSPSFTLRTKG